MEILQYDKVDGTNSEAKRLVSNGRPLGFAVSAKWQTAGRGRFDRVWQTLEGNLAVTIAVRSAAVTANRPTIALMTGIAIYDVLEPYVGARGNVAIKWPNDILIDGAKVSGTLIEADGEALYVGIGINVATKPQGVPYPAIALSEITEADIATLARELVDIWNSHHLLWGAQGFAPFISRYNGRLYRAGEEIRFALDRDKANWISGRCRGVDDHGHLLIQGRDGKTTAHSAGDVDIPR